MCRPSDPGGVSSIGDTARMGLSESCQSVRHDLSARLDGEPTVVDVRLLERHLRGCPTCTAFAASLDRLPATRVVGAVDSDAPSGPAGRRAAGALARLLADADRAGAPLWLRIGLLVAAIEVIVLALPDLLATDGDVHEARHLGAFSLAYGVALLVPVVRPARARSVLPVAVVLAGGLLVTTIVDVAHGRVPLISEVAHIPELASVVLLWLLARRQAQPGVLGPDS
jgi:predicted anti-sigma-YlaC factor YlaD